ncbi:E3 SUMO-protein ligase ZBED1-like [Argopecten irradians]|uniref:E3 SUMO-protein ligase ZBED1-like n=1 Tax=Argopecten irradians TaxID=31199 RepID=UPI0037109745
MAAHVDGDCAKDDTKPLKADNELLSVLENKTIYPHPGSKAKSEVWKYFGFLKMSDNLPPTKSNLNMNQAICRLCRKVYKNTGNTTNFQSHIDNEHKLHDTRVCKQKDKLTKLGNRDASGSTKQTFQTTLHQMVGMKSNNKLGAERKKEVDQSLMKMMAGKVLPFSLVDNVFFKNFVHALEPRYLLPSRRTLMGWLMQKKDEIEQKLSMEIRNCEGVAITHDSWTSLATESFNTTTVHFIDNNWELQSAVLGTIKVEGSHTAENIAASLTEVKTKWALPVCIATTDNAANEQKAFRILKWQRFGCYGHRLNLIVKNALQVNEVGRLVGKGRKLVTFFHTSTSANDKLMEKQKILQMKGIGHKLITDVVTRWNSTLDMLERLLEQMPALMAVATDESASKHIKTTVQNCLFTFEESLLAERIVTLLRPFQKVTTIVCSEKTPTINKVLPAITKLKAVS